MAAPRGKNVASHDPHFDEDSSLYMDALALTSKEKNSPTHEEKSDPKLSSEKSRQKAKNGSNQKSKLTKGQSQIQHDHSESDSENGTLPKSGHLAEKVKKHDSTKQKSGGAPSETAKIVPLMELNVTPQNPKKMTHQAPPEQDDFQSERLEPYNQIKVRKRREIRNVFTRMEGNFSYNHRRLTELLHDIIR